MKKDKKFREMEFKDKLERIKETFDFEKVHKAMVATKIKSAVLNFLTEQLKIGNTLNNDSTTRSTKTPKRVRRKGGEGGG